MPTTVPYPFLDGLAEPARTQLYRDLEELLRAVHSPGDIKLTAAAVADPGWMLCDGRSLKKQDYPGLFAALQYRYGGSGDNFNIPNLKGRVVVMQDAAQVEFDTLGETGGAKTHTLTAAQIPGHTHAFGHTHGTDVRDTNHAHNVYTRYQTTAGQNTNHAHVFETSWNSEVWNPNDITHSHQGGGGIGAERTSAAGDQWAASHRHSGTTAGVNADHGHVFDHDHPSTNYQSEAPWAGNWTHSHSTNSQSTSTTDAGTGGAGAHPILPPYLVLNYLVKT